MDVKMPDGTIITNVPDGTTQEDLLAQVNLSKMTQRELWKGSEQVSDSSILNSLKQTAKDIPAGLIRGAGSIGSTILWPADKLSDYLFDPIPGGKTRNEIRRQEIDAGMQAMGADPNSLAYKGSKVAAEIAGTAGLPGAFAKGATAIGMAPKVAAALNSGGFSLNVPSSYGLIPQASTLGTIGDAALRTGAAAITGGASAGSIDPKMAETGALIGGAMPGAVKVAGMAGSGVKNLAGWAVQHALGLSTGAGSNAIKGAFEAGKAGNGMFLDNMRGKVNMTDVLDDAKTALNNMRIARGIEYRQGMAGVSADKTVLNFAPIDKAVANVASMGAYKGVQINKHASGVVDDIVDTVNQWKSLNPADYHTPEGLDALKKAIGDIRDTTQYGTSARKAADDVYNAIKNQITNQAPTYAKTMKAYSDATELITEIQRSLVGGEKTAADTAMRKLQSLMRNNVNTNYGNRLDLMKQLEQQGGKDLLPAIAGQALSSATPRGLQALAATGTGIYGLTNPMALAALPFGSPRLMGEASYGMGRIAGIGNVPMQSAMMPQVAGVHQGLLSDWQSYLPLLTTAPAVALGR